MTIDRIDRARAITDPYKTHFPPCRKFGNPGGVGFGVFLPTLCVSSTIDDPGNIGIFPIGTSYLNHTERRGTDEIRPPAVVLIALNAEIFPFTKCGTTTENNVMLISTS
jgi:hypothetical protein